MTLAFDFHFGPPQIASTATSNPQKEGRDFRTNTHKAMKKEIQTAVDFLMRMVRVSCGSQKVDSDQLTNLRDMLTRMMETMYEHHWHPTNPVRGSGYRCIRINGMLDPLVKRAGEACGMSYESIRALFPAELTLWVDPDDVAYR